ncbi:MAG: DUF3108 domain-containing protein, partial [Propionivibrio sp.]|uniref:DUF3108 domain-containing protein n=1 Tax=Propionivibrio sp. TaxID=2212460 RepID=UPI001A44302B
MRETGCHTPTMSDKPHVLARLTPSMLNLERSNKNLARRRFLMALGVSLLLHFGVLSKPGFFSTAKEGTSHSPLQVSLVAPAATVSAPIQPPAASVPEVVLSAQENRVAQKIEKPPSTLVIAVKPAEPKNEAPPRIPEVLVKPSEAKPAVAASEQTSSPPAKESSDQSPGVPLPGLTGQVKQVTIEFEIYSGADRQLMGSGQHRYVSDDGRNYGVSIKQLLNDGDPVQVQPWQMEISGTIGRLGLNPILFQIQGAVPERLMAIKEVTENLSALPAKGRSGRMPDGLLDRQSLLYQFMLQPPILTGGKLWLSDGATHRVYTYRLGGIETFIIPSLGGVRTIKLVLSTSDSPEIIELWLVPDLHYLPAKVRHIDRQGVVTEQVVTSL